MTTFIASGFIITAKDSGAIYGAGETIAQAWAQVVEGVGTFFDAEGTEKTAEAALEEDFIVSQATAALIRDVNAGGQDSVEVADGIYGTEQELDD